MAVVIRLKRLGTKKKPHYRIIAIDWRKARNSKAIEELGFYDATKNPPFTKVNKDRALHWLKVGAKPSPTVSLIFKRSGII
ncbi:MAG: 30S ribosomal protein S16 [Omnitrophica WOR_2 bacterium SM23_29]|nr:MAG: 30S ribosomal protein S16 [Omnitrophica WOR_2 bacterium SM23_29]